MSPIHPLGRWEADIAPSKRRRESSARGDIRRAKSGRSQGEVRLSAVIPNYSVGYEGINAHYGRGTVGFSDGLVGYIDNTSIHTVMSVASAVPEPGSVVLLGLAFAAVTGFHIRNRRRTNA